MSKARMRMLGRAGRPLMVSIVLSAAVCNAALCQPPAAQAPGRASHATRQELIGAWRLVSIEILGPGGPRADPFYNTGSTGILVYDSSGWMSVQIVGQPRPAMDAPVSRPTPAAADPDARLKAAVLDTYYAYFGTWDFDEATSTVTHHVKSSLIPGEAGKSYSQTVTLDGEYLSFAVRRELAGEAVVQRKVWKRLPGPGRTPGAH